MGVTGDVGLILPHFHAGVQWEILIVGGGCDNPRPMPDLIG